ncbi:transporter [Niastella yeongjuensis]|uniref:Transporter n=1 Tax=Niastella yeongjuensis TaxID=354355 RepID=A0A1V9E9H2_9BACT|nr:TolC family protein [Niastella yeongjuensis]OQP42749.1 transporter [Niastella yeongjuensis]SEO52360.1 Outer membrane protein TolC [Niastella yeongjuensis]
MNGVSSLLLLLILYPSLLYPQAINDTTLKEATLPNCIRYGLEHQPAIRASKIDEDITETTIKDKLADWYPQLNITANYQHYLKMPVTIFPDLTNPNGPKRELQTGVRNYSTPQLALTQTIFNRDVLLATRTARDVRLSARQTTTANKIDVAAAISKAFYDVLLTQEQIQVLEETITRLDRSLKDAFYQYQGGLVDKTDYKRAGISLNNVKAQRKGAQDQLVAKYAYLKMQMGYPAEQLLELSFDTAHMEVEIALDTLQHIRYESRIEYQQLQTQQRLLQANVKYNQWSFIPTLSGFGYYNVVYQSDEFSKLFSHSFPNSYVGVQLAWPLFQGGKRMYNIRQANLQLKRNEVEMTDLKNNISSEYSQALATYKSNLSEFYAQKENLDLANEVYNTLALQYKSGIKTYLDVIVAETELRATQLNYYNSLYTVLSSKIDVEKALGTLSY